MAIWQQTNPQSHAARRMKMYLNCFIVVGWIVINKCFLFNGVAKAACADECGEGIEHKLRHIFMKELLGYPACYHGDNEEGCCQFSHAVASVLVFEEIVEAVFILFHDYIFCFLPKKICLRKCFCWPHLPAGRQGWTRINTENCFANFCKPRITLMTRINWIWIGTAYAVFCWPRKHTKGLLTQLFCWPRINTAACFASFVSRQDAKAQNDNDCFRVYFSVLICVICG